MKLLLYLYLQNNKISQFVDNIFQAVPNLIYLDISNNPFRSITNKVFSDLKKLNWLIMKSVTLEVITDQSFRHQGQLRNLFMQDTSFPDEFSYSIVRDMKNIEVIHTRIFQICCHIKNPSEYPMRKLCNVTKSYPFSSCDDLLPLKGFQILVWVYIAFGLVENIPAIIHRLRTFTKPIHAFYLGLTVSDGLTIVYLTIIAIFDVKYRNNYIRNDASWRNGFWCTFSGLLSSSSTLLAQCNLLMISMDRYFVIVYPFKKTIFSGKVVGLLIGVSVFFSVGLSLLPWLIYPVSKLK